MNTIKPIVATASRGKRATLMMIDDLINELEEEYQPKTDYSDFVDVRDIAKGDEIKPIGVWKSVIGVITPGGDPYYQCPICGKGGHLYGVECTENYTHKCRDCGADLIYPWEK